MSVSACRLTHSNGFSGCVLNAWAGPLKRIVCASIGYVPISRRHRLGRRHHPVPEQKCAGSGSGPSGLPLCGEFYGRVGFIQLHLKKIHYAHPPGESHHCF